MELFSEYFLSINRDDYFLTTANPGNIYNEDNIIFWFVEHKSWIFSHF